MPRGGRPRPADDDGPLSVSKVKRAVFQALRRASRASRRRHRRGVSAATACLGPGILTYGLAQTLRLLSRRAQFLGGSPSLLRYTDRRLIPWATDLVIVATDLEDDPRPNGLNAQLWKLVCLCGHRLPEEAVRLLKASGTVSAAFPGQLFVRGYVWSGKPAAPGTTDRPCGGLLWPRPRFTVRVMAARTPGIPIVWAAPRRVLAAAVAIGSRSMSVIACHPDAQILSHMGWLFRHAPDAVSEPDCLYQLGPPSRPVRPWPSSSSHGRPGGQPPEPAAAARARPTPGQGPHPPSS